MRENIISINFDNILMQTIYKPYQVFTINYLAINRETISRDVWLEHNDLFDDKKSRASFINFLDYLEASEVVHSIIETSKGGYRKKFILYDKFETEYDIFKYIIDKIKKKLDMELERTKDV